MSASDTCRKCGDTTCSLIDEKWADGGCHRGYCCLHVLLTPTSRTCGFCARKMEILALEKQLLELKEHVSTLFSLNGWYDGKEC